MPNVVEKSLPTRRVQIGAAALQWLIAATCAALAWLQLERSAGLYNALIFAIPPLRLAVGLLTAFALPLVLYAVSGRWWVATGVSGLALTVYAIANYYTRQLHGTAIMPQDLANLATAANVLGSYDLALDETVIKLALCGAFVLAAAVVQFFLGRVAARPRPWQRLAGGGVYLAALAWFGYAAPSAIIAPKGAELAMSSVYESYGYLPSAVSAARLLGNPVARPENYTAEAARQAAERAAAYQPAVALAAQEERPDILLILNESYYDPALVTDPQADAAYDAVYRELAQSGNALAGYTLVPDIGGGTNRSEYALLTSNAMELLPGATPFNSLDLHESGSLASYLAELGYASIASHPATPGNYRRGVAWPALGFQQTYFETDFPDQARYGERIYYLTDEAAMAEFWEQYQAMPQDQPRFGYLLTIQNHGGWDSNPPELALVHAGTDYGDNGAVMNEYLSCLSLTDAALKQLTERLTELYESEGRRVLLVMTGDHAPSFVDAIADPALTEQEKAMRERCTPFIVWANYPLEQTAVLPDGGVIDLCGLGPLVLEQAGLPLSPYYRYLRAMQQAVAAWDGLEGAVAADGSWCERTGEIEDWLNGYAMLEYNNIGRNAGYEAALFSPET